MPALGNICRDIHQKAASSSFPNILQNVIYLRTISSKQDHWCGWLISLTSFMGLCTNSNFVCLFGIRNRILPTGSTPKEGPTEFTLYHPGLVSVSVPSPPILLSWMPLASGRTLPCPIHIPYLVSGLFLPCLSVLHIYSNPTEQNPSTYFKPHKQTVLIH